RARVRLDAGAVGAVRRSPPARAASPRRGRARAQAPGHSPEEAVMRFSVVIPTLRREEILKETLDSLQSCEPPPFEVIVIDADTGGSAQPVVSAFDREVSPSVRYVRSPASLTLQRNLGINDASGDVVVFLDDDVSIPADVF